MLPHSSTSNASFDSFTPDDVGILVCQAITRAKRALWVCGNAATLRSSEVWDALVE